MNGLCPPSPGQRASGMLEGCWAMNGGGGSHLGPPSVRENQLKQGLQRLRLGLSRKEILQAGHSQASPAGPSALSPLQPLLGLWSHQPGQPWPAHLQQLSQHRWPDVRFGQQGERKGNREAWGGRGELKTGITQHAPAISNQASLLADLSNPLGHYFPPPASWRNSLSPAFSGF